MTDPLAPGAELSEARHAAVGEADPARRVAFDLLTRLATKLLRASAAVVTVTSEGRSSLQSASGLPAPHSAIPADARSLGDHVLKLGAVTVRDDVARDPEIAATWEVVALRVRALIAVPLTQPGGAPLGMFAIFEFEPRVWTAADRHMAEDLARACVYEVREQQKVEKLAPKRTDAAERALVKSERRYRQLVAVAPDALFVVVRETIVYANAAAVLLCGAREVGEVVGQRMDRFIEGPYLKRVRETILGEQAPAPMHAERFKPLSGATLHAEVASLPTLYDGRAAVLVYVHDVTARYQAELDLAEREGQLRLLLGQLPVYAWATDAKLTITSVTGGAADSPHPVAHAVGEALHILFDQTPGEAARTAHIRCLTGEAVSYRSAWRGRVFEVRVEPLVDPHAVIAGTVAVAMDVTERERIDAHVREAAQRDALGRVAGGVAYEMNNVLAAILGTAAAAAATPGLDAALRAELDLVSEAARRGGTIIRDLLGFAGKGQYRLASISVADLVRDVSADLRRELPPGIEVSLDIGPGVPQIIADRAQIEQVIRHICANAVSAMNGAGTLTLRVRSTWGGSVPGVHSRVEVTDTGVGMTEAVRARAVEPFFSTRPLGQGVGLGLSMAYGVVRNLRGALTIVSAPSRGTTVTIDLPGPPKGTLAPPRAAARPAPALVVQPGTVLLVEDDKWARTACHRVLRHLGYAVTEAVDGPEGLQLFQANPGGFALVILDMRMPQMNGEEVLRRLVAIDPDVRVILCTAYDRDQISPALFALGNVGFVGKPFGVEELEAEIRLLQKVASGNV